MRPLTLLLRTLFGLAFSVIGLNGALMSCDMAFMPQPEDLPAPAVAFFQAMSDTRYMLPLIGSTQLAAGLMLLSGLWAPLGLALLAPVVVNIVLYHHFVDPNGLGVAYAVLALELFLAWAYGPAFRGVLDPRAGLRWGKGGAGVK
jgi:uncharacterized membrane protein YphA (DoxX/SURF4 family)